MENITSSSLISHECSCPGRVTASQEGALSLLVRVACGLQERTIGGIAPALAHAGATAARLLPFASVARLLLALAEVRITGLPLDRSAVQRTENVIELRCLLRLRELLAFVRAGSFERGARVTPAKERLRVFKHGA